MRYPKQFFKVNLPSGMQERLHALAQIKVTKKNIPAITAIAILFIAALWLITGSEKTIIVAGNNAPNISQNSDSADIPPQSVRTFTSQAQDFQPILKLTGQTTPNRMLNIKSEISGRIENIPVDVGDIITPDSLLLQFAIEDRQAQLQEAEAEARRARKEYEVVKQLGEQGFKAEIAVLQAEAEQATAEAKLAKIRKEIRHVQIRAPYKAVITAKHAEVGDYLQQGEQALSLMEADPLLLEVQISERNFYDVSVGQTVKVKLANNIETPATIRTVAPAADEQTRTFAIEAAIDNSNYKYPIGATASVEIQLQPVRAHRVRSSHLSLNDQGVLGIKTLEGNLARFRQINIVGDDGGVIWVIGELPETITVIGEGQGFITDGQTVITNPEG